MLFLNDQQEFTCDFSNLHELTNPRTATLVRGGLANAFPCSHDPPGASYSEAGVMNKKFWGPHYRCYAKLKPGFETPVPMTHRGIRSMVENHIPLRGNCQHTYHLYFLGDFIPCKCWEAERAKPLYAVISLQSNTEGGQPSGSLAGFFTILPLREYLRRSLGMVAFQFFHSSGSPDWWGEGLGPSPGDVRHCLETVLMVTAGGRCSWHQVGRGGLAANTPQCTGHPHDQHWPGGLGRAQLLDSRHVSTVPRWLWGCWWGLHAESHGSRAQFISSTMSSPSFINNRTLKSPCSFLKKSINFQNSCNRKELSLHTQTVGDWYGVRGPSEVPQKREELKPPRQDGSPQNHMWRELPHSCLNLHAA